jgi:hypothetical protein
MTPERKEIEFWVSINETPPFVKECNIDWDGLVKDYKNTKAAENDYVYQLENKKYLDALNNLTDADVEAFEEDYKLPSSISEIMTLGSDMRLYFKKIPDKTPSTGGYVFDDIMYSFIENTEG